MPGLRRSFCGRPLGHGLAVILFLVAYLTTAIGCPLPTLLDKDRSQPFPCQDHLCGCRKAEACWRHCCCFTPEERLTWAQEHQVEPPPYAEKPRPQGWRTVRLRDQAEGQAQGASKCAQCQRPETSVLPGRASCCDSQRLSSSACSLASSRPTKSPSDQAQPHWLFGIAALHCQGVATHWILSGAVFPPPIPLSLIPDWPLVNQVPVCDQFALSHPLCPLDPPPRPLPA